MRNYEILIATSLIIFVVSTADICPENMKSESSVDDTHREKIRNQFHISLKCGMYSTLSISCIFYGNP